MTHESYDVLSPIFCIILITVLPATLLWVGKLIKRRRTRRAAMMYLFGGLLASVALFWAGGALIGAFLVPPSGTATDLQGWELVLAGWLGGIASVIITADQTRKLWRLMTSQA